MWGSRQLKKNRVALLSKQECVRTRQLLTKHAVQAYREAKLMFFSTMGRTMCQQAS